MASLSPTLSAVLFVCCGMASGRGATADAQQQHQPRRLQGGGSCQAIGGCANEGICVLAPPDDSNTLDSGYRCACQPGWTGPACDDPFDSCSTEMPCQNGGVCTLGLQDDFGNEQNFCECSVATSNGGPSYEGKWCEHQQAAITYCNNNNQNGGAGDGVFCIHGVCNPDFPGGPGPMCFCSSNEYGGQHCEFSKDSVGNKDCDLDCQNGGQCVLGESYQDIYHYWETKETTQDGKHCACPDDYDGPLCEHQKASSSSSACGPDGGHCYNGSTCVEKFGSDGRSHYHCDCSVIEGQNYYAGRFCQYKATTHCTSEASETPLFCVNNGRCKDNIYEGCDCDDPYTGFSCEFVLPVGAASSESETTTTTEAANNPPAGYPVNGDMSDPQVPAPGQTTTAPIDDPAYYGTCQLECQNGGVCRKGSKDMGILNDISRDIGLHPQTSNNDHEHCVCLPGWTSLDCSVKAEICGLGEHLCLHGSKCVSDGEYHACDCSTVDGDNNYDTTAFAGKSCEHKSSSICNEKGQLGPGKPLSFCTNHGTCKTIVSSEQPHPGCQCTDEWTGPHCELRVSSEENNNTPSGQSVSQSNNNNDDDDESALVEDVVLISCLVVLIALMIYCLRKYLQDGNNRNKKTDQIAEGLRFVHEGQEPYQDEPNISPHRDTVMELYSSKGNNKKKRQSAPSSSSDPFVAIMSGGPASDPPTRQASRVLNTGKLELVDIS